MSPPDAPSGRPRLLLVGNDGEEMLHRRLGLARAAASAGYEVHLAAPPGARSADLAAAGFPFHAFPLARRSLDPRHELRTRRALRTLYARLRPALVHHFTIKPVLHGGAAARALGIPAVHSITGLGSGQLMRGAKGAILRRLLARLYRTVLRHPRSRTVFQNPDDLELFVRRGLVPPGQARLIPGSGVDAQRFRPMPEPPGVVTVLFVGRFLRDKGVVEFVEASRLLASGPELRIALVGAPDAGNPSSIGDADIEAWRSAGLVETWGWQADMAATFARAHVVCLPSYREGIPRVLLEAAACGRPLVATDVPGCREVCLDGVTGLLVPARDAGALAAAIRRLAGDADLRARLGDAGRRLVLQRFTQERIEAGLLGVYAELVPPGE
jgi:glycosyltransferase involved in cell wall biosynthesis